MIIFTVNLLFYCLYFYHSIFISYFLHKFFFSNSLIIFSYLITFPIEPSKGIFGSENHKLLLNKFTAVFESIKLELYFNLFFKKLKCSPSNNFFIQAIYFRSVYDVFKLNLLITNQNRGFQWLICDLIHLRLLWTEDKIYTIFNKILSKKSVHFFIL